uniref:Uncharacterized protein n=1 Tax=viral metagenome TaxID=1070528 RepID=A0A6C0J7Z5_9ZZZZ
MKTIFIKNSIKIQRYYRCYKIKNIWNEIINNYDLKNKNKVEFFSYTKIIRDKNLIVLVNDFIDKVNKIKYNNTINSRIFLTSFLISNFGEELLGNKKKWNVLDTEIYLWSNKLISLLDDLQSYNKLVMLSTFINSYNLMFNHWKDCDKDKTIQNIIISYYNNQKHIEYIKESPNNLNESLEYLEATQTKLLKNIKLIDKDFKIESLIENYEQIYDNINLGMENLVNKITSTFKKVYVDTLIQELESEGNKMIYDLIQDTNKRIINIVPKQIKLSVTKKLNAYNFLDLLAEFNWSHKLIKYITFILDTIVILLETKNTAWKNEIITLFQKPYIQNFPFMLVEINKKIDNIYDYHLKLL